MGALSAFAAAKLMIGSKHSGSNMGVHLMLPPSFGLQLDGKDLVIELALRCGPIWKNADFVICGEDGRLLLVNGNPVAMESSIKVAAVDQYTPVQCTALTNVGYEPKFANDAFAFQETVVEMQQCLDQEKTETPQEEQPKHMITDKRHQEVLAMAQTTAFTSTSIQMVPPPGVIFVDPVKYRASLGVQEDQGEGAAMVSTSVPAQPSQGTAALKAMPIAANTTTNKGDANPQCNPTWLCEALGDMNNSLEHLETGYFNCFNITVVATREVLADLNEVIDTTLEAMRKYQQTMTLAILGMQTDDCTMLDAKHKAIDEATKVFAKACEASHITHAKAHEAHHQTVVKGDAKGPVIELLDRVLMQTQEAENLAVAAFEKQFREALVLRVPPKQMLILISYAYSTVSQFCLAIWQMVADKCIMPMWHDYLTSFDLATVMQHALEVIPSTCMRIVLPSPPDSKDNLTAFLDSPGNTLASRTLAAPVGAPTTPFSSMNPLPAVLPMGGLGADPAPAVTAPVFGGASLTPVPASVVTGVSLFQGSTAPLQASHHCQQGSVLPQHPPLLLQLQHQKCQSLLLPCPSPFLYRITLGEDPTS